MRVLLIYAIEWIKSVFINHISPKFRFKTSGEAYKALGRASAFCRRFGCVDSSDMYMFFAENAIRFRKPLRHDYGWYDLMDFKLRKSFNPFSRSYILTTAVPKKIFYNEGSRRIMSVGIMRSEIEKVYPGPKWREKVKRMSDNQVIAVYSRFRQSGKIK